MARPVIQIIGSLNMDLVTTTHRMPGPGETISASSFETGYGGKGANQAVACARVARTQGKTGPIEVQMVGCVGDDLYGSNFLDHFRKEGINVDSVRTVSDVATGTAVILVEEETGENRILVIPGANGRLMPDDLKVEPHGGYSILQHEVPKQTVVSYISRANQQGIKVILNPAPAFPLDDEVLQGLYCLVMNESEAAILSGMTEKQVQESLEDAAAFFLKRGVQIVIITLGAKGAYWKTATILEAGQRGELQTGEKVSVVDTTAAGDTFVGAFAVHLALHGEDVAAAIRFANQAASISVQKKGAQASIPFADEIKQV